MEGVWAVVEGIIARMKEAGVPAHEIDPFFILAEVRDNPAAVADEISGFLGGMAVVEPLSREPEPGALQNFLEVRFPWFDSELGRPLAFDLAHDLRLRFSLRSSEPRIDADFYPDPSGDPDGAPSAEKAMLRGLCEVSGSPPQDRQWALNLIRAREAIAYAGSKGRPAAGDGIIVAQPDTGYRIVKALAGSQIAAGGGWDIFRRQPDGADPLDYDGHPGHGTATGSCVVSNSPGNGFGVAPSARLYPIRCIENVVVLRPDRVARALEHACRPELGVDVITMSLGGVPSEAVRAAMRAAIRAGKIVLAAAGNCVRIVVWPARYAECIAVAGCNIDRKPWKGSCRGPDVDITAPGQMVWHATTKEGVDDKDGQGTSFAVALTAGAAAQWLAFHGRAAVEAEAAVRRVTVQELFMGALRATASASPRLPKGKFGAGILDVERLLRLPLDAVPAMQPLDLAAAAPAETITPADLQELEVAFGGSDEGTVFEWTAYRHELATLALERARLAAAIGVRLEAAPPGPPSRTLQSVVGDTGSVGLRAWIGRGG